MRLPKRARAVAPHVAWTLVLGFWMLFLILRHSGVFPVMSGHIDTLVGRGDAVAWAWSGGMIGLSLFGAVHCLARLLSQLRHPAPVPHEDMIIKKGFRTSNAGAGWVYLLSNPAMPGYYKVGFSAYDPHDRARQLRNTGVPRHFRVLWSFHCRYAMKVERQAHRLLEDRRFEKDREFFRGPPIILAAGMIRARRHVERVARKHGISTLAD